MLLTVCTGTVSHTGAQQDGGGVEGAERQMGGVQSLLLMRLVCLWRSQLLSGLTVDWEAQLRQPGPLPSPVSSGFDVPHVSYISLFCKVSDC